MMLFLMLYLSGAMMVPFESRPDGETLVYRV